MAIGIDAPPKDYTLSWSPSSEIPLDAFLAQPSSTSNDRAGSKPYIWVLKSEVTSGNYKECTKEAKIILTETAQKVMEIRNNPAIPTRAKKGVQNKKEMRERVQASAAGSLKEIAVKHNFVAGKWLAFLSEEEVDPIFSEVARSLISGELSHTSATHIGINTSSYSDNPKPLFYLAVYVPDVYDEDMAREVMKILTQNHGLKLSGAKPNLYTSIWLTSKHDSGIPATVWKGQGGPGSLMTKEEVAALRRTYDAGKAANGNKNKEEETKTKATIKGKNRSKHNPFTSEDEDDEVTKPALPRKRLLDPGDDEAEGEPPRKMVKLEDTSTIPVRAEL